MSLLFAGACLFSSSIGFVRKRFEARLMISYCYIRRHTSVCLNIYQSVVTHSDIYKIKRTQPPWPRGKSRRVELGSNSVYVTPDECRDCPLNWAKTATFPFLLSMTYLVCYRCKWDVALYD